MIKALPRAGRHDHPHDAHHADDQGAGQGAADGVAMRVTVLGCGGSSGVPLIGNIWGDCDPSEPRNRRRRSSILLEHDGTSILVDTTPDLREQLLSADVRWLDALLYTHDHADHTNGIDDLRAINWLTQRPLDVYSDAGTLERLAQRFSYCFRPARSDGMFPYPVLVPKVLTGPTRIGAIDVIPFVQDHGYSESLGFRFGSIAYSTDVVSLDESAYAILHGVEVWIVDCTRMTPHPVHAHLERTLSWIERVQPRRAYLTHMNHTMDYRSLLARLPAGVEPAYDGLVVELDGD